MTHALKTIHPYFKEIVDGVKTFEVRKADRPFKVGDKLLLQEYDIVGKVYSGDEWNGTITYILNDEAFCKKGFIILGIKEIES